MQLMSPRSSRARKVLLPLLVAAGVGLVAWFFSKRSRRRPIVGTGSFAALEQAVIGATKDIVAAVFGPPRAAAVQGVVHEGDQERPAYWQANTWYYLLDRRDRSAMAIEFIEGKAARVDRIRNPNPLSRT
jgi:hypothetical protein